MDIKQAHRDALVFFRLGDFYELFFDDARLVAEKLGLTLTSRETGSGKCPMCGMPHHAAEAYIMRLVEMGHRVALAEQVGEAKKGAIVRREVVQVYTPGTVMKDTNVRASYIAAIFQGKDGLGLAYCDVSTGDFLTTSFDGDSIVKFLDEIHKIAPAEIIVNADFTLGDDVARVAIRPVVYNSWAFMNEMAQEKLSTHFGVHNLEGFGFTDNSSINASGALLFYLYEVAPNAALSYISSINPYVVTDHMILDKNVRRNLELFDTLREKEYEGTLMWVMDRTKTAMGRRLLRKWMENPLLNVDDIKMRQQAVADFLKRAKVHDNIRSKLADITDLERFCAKISYRKVSLADFYVLGKSIASIASVKGSLSKLPSHLNAYFAENIDSMEDVGKIISEAISDDDGRLIIADGLDAALDTLRDNHRRFLGELASLEVTERQNTGIKNLKIGYNKVFGHYIEVNNSQKDAVPPHYQRRQTLSGCERYTTETLLRLEENILQTSEEINVKEDELFKALREKIAAFTPRIQLTTHMIAAVDVLQGFAKLAAEQNYSCPEMMDVGIIEIKGGRHPVVETILNEKYVANDAYLDTYDDKVAIITGPNMAGKSTYLRQVALICIMAQMGSYVPADTARLPICDRIFTRVGASDDLARGQSTFMVEMNEVASILNNATENSLLILDEIGRGTGTADGFALALAIIEHIAYKIKAKTLFATHFHELTAAEGKVGGVVNYCMQVKEDGESISFLRKIKRGGADKSYGISVAKLAGLPEDVIKRSAQIQERVKMRGAFKDDAAVRAETDFFKRVRLHLDETGFILHDDDMLFMEDLP